MADEATTLGPRQERAICTRLDQENRCVMCTDSVARTAPSLFLFCFFPALWRGGGRVGQDFGTTMVARGGVGVGIGRVRN